MLRPADAVSVEWSEIDFDKSVWHIPAVKMKKVKTGQFDHSVPLSRQMLAILAELRPITGQSLFVSLKMGQTAMPQLGAKQSLGH